MRTKAKDSLRPKIFQSPAAAAAAASVTAAYALTKSEKLDFPDINSKTSLNNDSQEDATAEIESIKEEKEALELSLTEVRAENSKLSVVIDEVKSTHDELSKVCSKKCLCGGTC